MWATAQPGVMDRGHRAERPPGVRHQARAFSGSTRNYWDTEFEYGEYRETCANSAGYYQDSYQVRPIEWIGGERERHPGTPNLTKCVWYPGGPGDVVSRTGTAAVNWSNGVDISGWLGSLSLSTQTGYSNSASITFDMNNASNITLCGRYDYPMGNNPGPGDILART